MTPSQHVLKAYDMADFMDEIASSNPPAFLRRCFAEALSTAHLSWPRVQELAACATVLDAVVGGQDADGIEAELIADWRAHYTQEFAALKNLAGQALARALGPDAAPGDADQLSELRQLRERLAAS